MDTLYEAPLCPYQKNGIKVIIKSPTIFSTTKPVALKLERQCGSKYKTVLETCLFYIMPLLNDCAKEENNIPKTLSNVEGGTRLRSTWT